MNRKSRQNLSILLITAGIAVTQGLSNSIPTPESNKYPAISSNRFIPDCDLMLNDRCVSFEEFLRLSSKFKVGGTPLKFENYILSSQDQGHLLIVEQDDKARSSKVVFNNQLIEDTRFSFIFQNDWGQEMYGLIYSHQGEIYWYLEALGYKEEIKPNLIPNEIG